MRYETIMDKIMEGKYLSKKEVGFVGDSIKKAIFSDFQFISF